MSSHTYSGVHIRIDKPCFMKQMAYFWPSLIGNKNAITPLPFRVHFSIDCSFKTRYCMNFYLNWCRSYVRLKLKACFLLSEFGSSKFDLSQFLCQLRQKVEQYLILKLQSILKWSLKGWSLMAFLFPTKLGQKQAICFIKPGLPILICKPLYITIQNH